MKRTLTLFFALGLNSLLQAQTASESGGPPPLPPGPLVQVRAPDFAEWVVTQQMGLPDGANSGPNTPTGQGAPTPDSTQDTITKTHDVIRVVRLDVRKQPWTIWCQGGQEYMIWPDGKSCGQITPGRKDLAPNPSYIDYSGSDFSGFDWVSLQNYTGIKSYQGTKCIVFQTLISQSTRTKKVAYIDFTSRLPLALQNGDEEYLYAWHPPPQEMLSFPSVVQALIDAGGKAQREMAQKAVRPW